MQPRSGRAVPNCLDSSTASSFVTLWWWRHGIDYQNGRGSFVFLNSWTFHLIYRLPLLFFFGREGFISQLNPGSALPGVTPRTQKVLGKMSAWGFFSFFVSVLSGVCPVISTSGHHWRAQYPFTLHLSEFTSRRTLQYLLLVWHPLWFFHVFPHPLLAALRRVVWNTWPPADKVTDGMSRISDLNNILWPWKPSPHSALRPPLLWKKVTWMSGKQQTRSPFFPFLFSPTCKFLTPWLPLL